MKKKYETEKEFSTLVRCLPALAFVPECDVASIFNALSKKFPDTEPCKKLLEYFEKTYIHVKCRNNRKKAPLYPIKLWNHFDSAQNELPKTTNATEGYHNALQSLFLCSHPTIWKLIRGLEKDMHVHRHTLAQASVQNVERRKTKYQKQSTRLAEMVSAYPNEGSDNEKLAYLRSVSLITIGGQNK